MEKIELVFIPSIGLGHVISMVEMGNLLLSRYPNLSATFLIINMKSRPNVDVTSLITSLSSSDSHDSTRIRFLQVSREEEDDSVVNPEAMFSLSDLYNPIIKETVQQEIITRSGSGRLVGFILDMFCAGMVDVAKEFKVPGYVFFSSGASLIGLMWHLQTLQDEYGQNLVDLDGSDVELDVPVFKNRYPAKVIPPVLIDKEGGSKIFLRLARMLRKVDGIAVNTFSELESHAIKVLSDDDKIPSVYPVGPILKLKKENDEDSSADIIRWLDGQPSSSVIFLCFGSMETFTVAQVKEIAYALENTGKRFLWSLRRPSGTDKKRSWITSDYKDPNQVLPEGFLERTSDIGRVIGWAPQVEVLSHEAVGGFVSHCGWNSTLETVWFGVPTATWPIQAEQNMNAFFMVKEVGLSVDVKMDYRQSRWKIFEEDSATVPATVIERALRQLMDENSEECLEMRKRMKEMSDKSRKAVAEGGSSNVSIGRFVDDIINQVAKRQI
ncbi:anthocyanidin 3-O-glucosyltransferase 2-like [Impatiens glandulifera]|uniref:anthocyanidin 3-O-glucosyltransferase 2-like n=1 Tax=Impatiens glandulifera TaxID=253017 RepID=UPI001FB18D30|nr:anthocyanidin 3-O-glucosyltransferase 2-like [Impatiens glandulifera]